MEKPLESDIKHIAIKLPFDLQSRILAFPFLHAISEYYPKAELHFITPRKEIEVLNLLPFKAYYHEFDEDEISNIFDVHRFCANAKIYNIDIFFSLTNSFPDACLGLGLGAKTRVGFSDNWKTLVLTHKTLRPQGHHLVEDYLTLYKEAVGESVDKKLKVVSRDLSPIIKDEEPYLAINLSPLRGVMIEDEWIELFKKFEGQKIVLFASDEQVKIQLLMENFLEKLPKKNTYFNFVYRDWIELGRMLAHARGVITYSGPCGALSAYVGSKTLILYENEDPQKTGPFYFMGEVSVMGVNNPTLVNSSSDAQLLKDRKTFNMMEVASKAWEFFTL
jgi:ADP-heptose:LPS heptosyltransferase